jgi:CBS domain-containing protein
MKEKEAPSTIKGIMSTPVITTDIDSSVQEAARMMTEKRIGSIVVTKEGKPMGITTERDVLQKVVAKGLDASKVRTKMIMTQPLITVDETTPILKAIRIMEKNKTRRLLVVKNDNLVGIATQRDLLRALMFHVLISFRPLL